MQETTARNSEEAQSVDSARGVSGSPEEIQAGQWLHGTSFITFVYSVTIPGQKVPARLVKYLTIMSEILSPAWKT